MSAICVQNFDDSLSPAIHTRYRISLRSSSLREPRYPLLRVVYGFHSGQGALALSRIQMYCSVCENELMGVECWKPTHIQEYVCGPPSCARICRETDAHSRPHQLHSRTFDRAESARKTQEGLHTMRKIRRGGYGLGVNDPSAGSPTETLLRLLLPLNDKV